MAPRMSKVRGCSSRSCSVAACLGCVRTTRQAAVSDDDQSTAGFSRATLMKVIAFVTVDLPQPERRVTRLLKLSTPLDVATITRSSRVSPDVCRCLLGPPRRPSDVSGRVAAPLSLEFGAEDRSTDAFIFIARPIRTCGCPGECERLQPGNSEGRHSAEVEIKGARGNMHAEGPLRQRR